MIGIEWAGIAGVVLTIGLEGVVLKIGFEIVLQMSLRIALIIGLGNVLAIGLDIGHVLRLGVVRGLEIVEAIGLRMDLPMLAAVVDSSARLCDQQYLLL